MFWRVFFAVLAALLVFTVIVVGLMAAGSYAAQEDLRQQLVQYRQASAAQAESFRAERELKVYQDQMRRSVCRNGMATIPRRSGSVTYFDPVVWRGAPVRCRQ